MATLPKRALGKGLDAYFEPSINREMESRITNNLKNDDESFSKEEIIGKVLNVDINKIVPNKEQPRKHFEKELLEELAMSIKEFGVIQPLIVKKDGDFFTIVAGERRWRASRIAKLSTLPVIVKDYSDSNMLEVALIENIQRSDLNPIEEALCYRKLIDEHHLTQEILAQRVGKNRSTIANSMRLLKLNEKVQNFIISGKLSMGHAKALLGVEDEKLQFDLAEKIIEDELSVREIEEIIRTLATLEVEEEIVEVKRPAKIIDSDLKIVENKLNELFGTKVQIKGKKNKGKIEIEYYSVDDLDRLVQLFNSN